MSCFWIGWLNIYKSIHWLIHIVEGISAQPQNRTKGVKKWMKRETVRIKSHVQVEEKVEKSDLKATDKILQRTTVAHERTKHINMSNIHHFVREGPQRGTNNLKYVRFDGMVADTLSHSGKKVSIVKKWECCHLSQSYFDSLFQRL